MERLTKKNGLGGLPAWHTIQSIYDTLAEYEDTGLKPGDIRDMHNELCLKCGNYQREHLGACNGCRWRKEA